ncbi:hypothetical protein PENTCL1PPCAC_15844, partial [Pristionchus entomophagus]
FIQAQTQSKPSIRSIRKSLIVLFVQEFCLACFGVIILHSVGHNMILLSTTPVYRQFILSVLFCPLQAAQRRAISQTPPHQSAFRKYLIYIQILITLNDIFVDILVQPVPVFPAPTGYCVGVLCRCILSLNNVAVSDANIGVSLIICCQHGHQTVLLPS